VFALGRAQELCILLETYWDRMNLKVPIYFSTGLTEKVQFENLSLLCEQFMWDKQRICLLFFCSLGRFVIAYVFFCIFKQYDEKIFIIVF